MLKIESAIPKVGTCYSCRARGNVVTLRVSMFRLDFCFSCVERARAALERAAAILQGVAV